MSHTVNSRSWTKYISAHTQFDHDGTWKSTIFIARHATMLDRNGGGRDVRSGGTDLYVYDSSDVLTRGQYRTDFNISDEFSRYTCL